LLTVEDAKLERLKFAISFTIVNVFCVKQSKTNACYQRIQKLGTEILFHLGRTIHWVKKHLSRLCTRVKRRGGKGGTTPRAPDHCGGSESLRGCQMSAGGAEKSQQFRKYFLQYSTFRSERPQVRTWWRQTCFLPRAQSNLVTFLTMQSSKDYRNFYKSDQYTELLPTKVFMTATRLKTCGLRWFRYLINSTVH